ncbi:MAG TPA: hypothetical protein VHU83_00495 [Bryobacteraceae bacterium]|jgi:hypothetical protein|nr:hypothetical protein [Bryobacteraceae bacterium]
MAREFIFQSEPILVQLGRAGVEPDQRLRRALEMASLEGSSLIDSHVFHALLRLHARVAWQPKIENAIEIIGDSLYRKWLWLSNSETSQTEGGRALESATANIGLQFLLSRAFEIRQDPHTLGANDFLKAIAQLAVAFPKPIDGTNVGRPHTVDMLC